jgi:glycosyltransferase involved in cell wall biosynthesis
MPAPKVSVVIPTYCHRDFILTTLDSVFNQTTTDYEVIVVNDGSTDDTAAILAPLIDAKRIDYIEQSNQGQNRARNRGIERARGDYIALLDDDDTWPRDKLRWQIDFLDANPHVGMVGGTLQAIDENDSFRWKGTFTPVIDFETLFAANPFLSPGQTLIRANLLKQLGGMNPTIWGADDWDLWFRIAKASKIVMVDRLALYYRLHPGNASKQTARLLRAACETLEAHLRDVAPRDRGRLRTGSHRTLYAGFGSLLVRGAKGQLRHGQLSAAMKSMKELLPLWYGILLDNRIRAQFVRDLLTGKPGP